MRSLLPGKVNCVGAQPSKRTCSGVDRKSRAIMLSIKAKEMHEETQAVQSYKAEGAAGTRLGDLLKEHMPGQDDA